VKFTFGGLATVTAATPASCSTVNEADEFVAVSFAATAAAALMISAVLAVGGSGGGVAASSESLPQPANVASTTLTTPQMAYDSFMRSSSPVKRHRVSGPRSRPIGLSVPEVKPLRNLEWRFYAQVLAKPCDRSKQQFVRGVLDPPRKPRAPLPGQG
jgi:hypothetical protein